MATNNSAQGRRGAAALVSNLTLLQAPPTPGRPVFSFSIGNFSRKSIPSKWDDAEKWLISGSCRDSPGRVIKPPETSLLKQSDILQHRGGLYAERFRVAEQSLSGLVPACIDGSLSVESNVAFQQSSPDVLLKDKFSHGVRYSEPTQERFLFRSSGCETMKASSAEALRVGHRDIGTEMTPFGSSTTSRCHTPFTSSSPARHNTPTTTSGSPVTSNSSIDISELQRCHFAKMELSGHFDSTVSQWSSREEEEEEVSKSLRHFQTEGGCESVTGCRASLWEEEEKSKSCIRYQREEAKIQAWVNLKTAKAEAESKKLEVKIQKMRSKLEGKLMKRMAVVHRKAEERRASAQLQHSMQIQRAAEQAEETKNENNSTGGSSCACFPILCNFHH